MHGPSEMMQQKNINCWKLKPHLKPSLILTILVIFYALEPNHVYVEMVFDVLQDLWSTKEEVTWSVQEALGELGSLWNRDLMQTDLIVC